MKRYSEYKDTGVEWIGEIPGHWELSKIRSLFKLSREKNTNPNATLLSLSQYTGVQPKNECEKSGMFEAESTIGYNVVRKGQLVMNIMLAWNGSYAVSKYDGIISPAYCVFDFIKDCNKDYFDYLLRLKSYSGAFKTLSKGLIDSRLRLYPDYFKTFHIIVPPIEEQQTIVTYLESKVSKIDEFISIAEKKISTLEELKQTIIAEAVTKGINKNVTMKDSGVNWIGEIPEHWKICRLKNCSQIILGKMLMSTPPKGETKYTKEKYLKSRNVGWLNIYDNYDDVEEMWFNEYEKSIYRLHVNDIVMNEGGDIGKIGLWKNNDFPCYIQNSINKITSNRNMSPVYLLYNLFTLAKNNYFKSIVNSVSIAHLTKDKLSVTPVLVPPLSEQQAIADYLDTKVSKIDHLCQAERSQIEKLKEYKQRLISDVVTGKVKVIND